MVSFCYGRSYIFQQDSDTHTASNITKLELELELEFNFIVIAHVTSTKQRNAVCIQNGSIVVALD